MYFLSIELVSYLFLHNINEDKILQGLFVFPNIIRLNRMKLDVICELGKHRDVVLTILVVFSDSALLLRYELFVIFDGYALD